MKAERTNYWKSFKDHLPLESSTSLIRGARNGGSSTPRMSSVKPVNDKSSRNEEYVHEISMLMQG